MQVAERMDQLIQNLIKFYKAEMRPSGLLYLELRMDGHGVLIIEEKIKHRQMRVCYWLFDDGHRPVPEPELQFYIDAGGGWIPYEIHRHTAGHYAAGDLDPVSGQLKVTDVQHQAALACFADFWAEILRAQGWLGGANKCITQPQADSGRKAHQRQRPDVETLWDWVDEYGGCEATDGCWVEVDGTCQHGHKSWLLELGLI